MTHDVSSADEDGDVSSSDVSGLPKFFYGRASHTHDRQLQTDDVRGSCVSSQTDDVGTSRASRVTALSGMQSL